MIRIAVAAAVLVVLGGCSTMSEEDCATADWTALGERDGLYGESQKKYDERRAQCSKYGYETASDDYTRGRDRGLRTYCTPQAGFDAGRNGRPYNNVCPPELEGAFLSEYQIGRQLYDLTENVRRAREAYDDAKTRLDRERENLDRARARLREEGISDEERSQAQRDLENARREIERLQDALQRARDDIRDSEGRLEDFRQFLARRNR